MEKHMWNCVPLLVYIRETLGMLEVCTMQQIPNNGSQGDSVFQQEDAALHGDSEIRYLK
jgi:hypothetical protein